MKGRWTINVCSGCGQEIVETFEYRHFSHGPEARVPVVPCDDAALERAADEIERLMTDSTVWNVREAAERVLRAAAGP